MKIGLVCPYSLWRGGGVQEVVLALNDGLTKKGHDVKLITPLPDNVDDPGHENVIFVGSGKLVKSPFSTSAEVSFGLNKDEIDTMLEREKFDLLNFHEPWVPMMSRQLLSQAKDSVNVATFHAKLPETALSKSIERVITPYTKSIMKYLDRLTAVSEPAAEYVKTLTNMKIDIVPNGIDLAKFKKHKPKKISNKQTILYIGRLEKRKGVKYLLRAYAEVAEKNNDVSLVIVGEGPEKDLLTEYVYHKEVPRVKFKGYVSEKQKLKLLSEATLFCSPALFGESFGIVLLEAMASGVVTIAGNNSGYKSVMQDRGGVSLINPKDTERFAHRIELMLNDKPLRDLWLDWSKEYIKQFDYPKIVDMYERVYLDAIKSK